MKTTGVFPLAFACSTCTVSCGVMEVMKILPGVEVPMSMTRPFPVERSAPRRPLDGRTRLGRTGLVHSVTSFAREERGITLVEMLVAVAILGGLAAIGI